MEQDELSAGLLRASEDLQPTKPKPEWPQITFVIITSFLGAGVLTLPFSLSRLGYLPFYLLITFVALASLVTSDCYARLYRKLPKSKVLADVAREAFGPLGETLVRRGVALYLFGIITIFHLTCTISLQQIVGRACSSALGLAVSLCAFAAMQARSMQDLSMISVVGSCAIIIPCAMLLIVIPSRGRREGAENDFLWASSTSPTQKAVAFMDLTFAYAGQMIFIELQSSMAKPSENFMKSVFCSNFVMTVVYCLVAAVGYYYVGRKGVSDGDPISTHLSDGPALKTINAFIVLHVLIAYAVEGNILARGILHSIGRGEAAEARTAAARFAWMTTTAGIVVAAYLICTLFPFFSDVMSLVSATCGISLNFTLPLILVLKLCPPISATVRILYKVFIFLTILVAIAGTVASGIDISNKFVFKAPFSC